MLSRLASSLKELAANLGSLSDMILSGSLNLVNTLLIKSLAMSLAVACSEVGMKITPFVRLWSTTDNMAFMPAEGGSPVIRSQEI